VVNALEVLDRAISSRPTIAIDRAMQGRACLARDLIEARAAVADLIAAAHRAEVSFNTVRGCYERNPGNFMVAMRELEADGVALRVALARCGGAS
jgi:hypothetical protein